MVQIILHNLSALVLGFPEKFFLPDSSSSLKHRCFYHLGIKYNRAHMIISHNLTPEAFADNNSSQNNLNYDLFTKESVIESFLHCNLQEEDT